MAVSDYNTNPALNTAISGINVAEGCAPSGLNNAFRQLMADVRAFWNKAYKSNGATAGTVYVQSNAAALPGSPVDGDIVIQYAP